MLNKAGLTALLCTLMFISLPPRVTVQKAREDRRIKRRDANLDRELTQTRMIAL